MRVMVEDSVLCQMSSRGLKLRRRVVWLVVISCRAEPGAELGARPSLTGCAAVGKSASAPGLESSGNRLRDFVGRAAHLRPRMLSLSKQLTATSSSAKYLFTLATMSSTHSAAPTPPAQASARSRSPPSSPEGPSKRAKLDDAPGVQATAQPTASTSKLPYSKGLHLAPMVRIGTLPNRLLCQSGPEAGWTLAGGARGWC